MEVPFRFRELKRTGMNRILAAAVATSLLSTPWLSAAGGEFSLDVESGAVWNSKADVRIPNPAGSLFSLNNDLRARDPQAFIRGRATWHLTPHHELSVLYAPLEMDFRGTFNRPVNFAGSNFAPGVSTRGRYRFDSYRLTYRYNLISNRDWVFGLGITAKVRDAEVRLDQGAASARDANTGFVPLLNYRLQWRFAEHLSFLTEGDALGASQGYAVDAMASVQWHATERLSFRLGYRVLDGGADNDSIYTFSRFHYSSLGATYAF
jgi:hypothetical protein